MTHNELQTAAEELEALVNTKSDYAQAETQARLLLAEAGIENEPELHCKVLLALSDSLWRRGLAQDAMPYSELASSIAQDNQLKHLEARALGNTGVQLSILTDYAHALEYLHKALEIDEEQGNKQGMSRHTNNIGKVHNALSDYTRALEYYKQSLLYAEETQNENLIECAFSDIANAYLHLSDYPKALEYFNKELSRCDKIRRKDKLQAIKANIGIVHHLLSN